MASIGTIRINSFNISILYVKVRKAKACAINVALVIPIKPYLGISAMSKPMLISAARKMGQNAFPGYNFPV